MSSCQNLPQQSLLELGPGPCSCGLQGCTVNPFLLGTKPHSESRFVMQTFT